LPRRCWRQASPKRTLFWLVIIRPCVLILNLRWRNGNYSIQTMQHRQPGLAAVYRDPITICSANWRLWTRLRARPAAQVR
jgi:hypothetical protein